MDYRLIVGFLLFMTAQTVAWYQLNSQFVWEYWKDKAILSSLMFGMEQNIYMILLRLCGLVDFWGLRAEWLFSLF